MTAETAFGVLHLLEHVREGYVASHTIWRPLDTMPGSPMPLNPSIIRLLSIDGNAFKLRVQRYWPTGLPNTVQTFAAGVTHLKIGELFGNTLNLELISDFVLHGKPFCKRFSTGVTPNDTFDAVLQVSRELGS
jgi:hypothetical protein